MTTSTAPAVQTTTLFVPDLGSRKREGTLQFLVSRAATAGVIRAAECVRDTLILRERLGTTAIGKGVAVPHVRSLGVIEPRLVLARSARGIEWDAPDGQPVHLVLLVLSPAETPLDTHLDQVSRAVAATRLARHRARLLDADSAEEAAALLRQGAP